MQDLLTTDNAGVAESAIQKPIWRFFAGYKP